MNFVIRLLVSTNQKGETYNSILVIVKRLIKMVYQELVRITINTPSFVKLIIDVVVVQHHGLPNLFMSYYGSVFDLKFCSSLYYFLEIKQKLSTVFYMQINNQTEKQNSTMKAYLQAFMKYEQNDQIKLFLMTIFAYNNAKNAGLGLIFIELNCSYHFQTFYKQDMDLQSKPKLVEKLI